MSYNQSTLKEYAKKQEEIASRVIRQDVFSNLKLVCGLDIAYTKNKSVAAAVTLDLETLSHIESKCVSTQIYAPYIPSYLGLREVPPMIQAFNQLDNKPDILMVDSNGILHPRRAGAASHLGVTLDIPTIGVAKKLLLGHPRHDPKYDFETIQDRGEIIGAQLNRRGKASLIVSIGHKITLETAVKITRQLIKSHRQPEPIFQAHKLANSVKQE